MSSCAMSKRTAKWEHQRSERWNIIKMKKRPEATQTLRDGCNKADPQTNKQTNTQTDRGDYNTQRSLARSVMKTVLTHYIISFLLIV